MEAATTCKFEGCTKPSKKVGFCEPHYTIFKRYGRNHLIRKKNKGQTCLRDGCEKPSHSAGFCKIHYLDEIRNGSLKNPEFKHSHKLYPLWVERRSQKILSDEWLDFWKFLKDVGEKPGKYYLLIRPDQNRPYGRDNFEWRPHLKREVGESKKAWHARKWAHRAKAIPGWDRRRTLKSKYGITSEQYDDMLKAQKDVCAVCLLPETALEHRSATAKRLAVDHCHASGKIRGLLCWRCNSMLGKVGDNPDLLIAMAEYLKFHATES